MKKKITLCMVLSTFIICAMLCLTNCSNDYGHEIEMYTVEQG